MTSYNNPTPVAVSIVRVGANKVLAVRRGIAPNIGEFALPGGYVDEGETAEQACARELFEETGIIIPSDQWTPITTRITARNILLIFMVTDISITEEDLLGFVPNREVLELKSVDHNDELAFAMHNDVLNKYFWVTND